MTFRTPILRTPRTTICVVIACLVVWALSSVHSLDFNVYRSGARAYLGLDGETDLYVRELWRVTDDSWLPFTYPPFAVLLFIPYAIVPTQVGAVIHTLVLTMSMLAVLHLILTRTPRAMSFLRSCSPWQHALMVGGATLAVGFSGPWREGLSFGQINALLMAVILFDMLARRRAGIPKGLLTGIAAGIKLTPLAMGLYFLVQRDWKSIAWMGLGFMGTVGVGFALTPSGSVHYWTEAIFATSRVGNDADMYSVTLNSFSQHLGLSVAGSSYLWIGLCIVTIALGYYAIKQLLEAGETVAAVGATAIVMLMISPISWYHHWVWFILLIPAMLFPSESPTRRGSRLSPTYACAYYIVFIFSSYSFSIAYFGSIRGTGPWWMEILSSVWIFVSVFAVALLVTITTRRGPATMVNSGSAAPVRVAPATDI